MAKKTQNTKSKTPRQGPVPQSSSGKAPQQAEEAVSPQDAATRRQHAAILEVFRRVFGETTLSADDFTTTLQEVKQALFNREFDKAFGNEKYLDVYAARWSPPRAMCYSSVLGGVETYLRDILQSQSAQAGEDDAARPPPSRLRVLSIGGAAAELIAVGSFLAQLENVSGDVYLLDSGPWDSVVQKLYAGLTTPPPVSKYASEAARAAVSAIIPPSRLTSTFRQVDVLEADKEYMSKLLGADGSTAAPVLITVFFTLNELFTAGGIGKTTKFLMNLTAAVPSGSLLLVVDSPGSYSETVVGKQSRKYPMHWLLDKVLTSVEDCEWTKLESHDSIWFRLPERVDYPISLENMRYQMHLYRAVKPAPSGGP
ncbi:uncharacterized protein E0L32_008352 [Thyridium curvatum]|uniref:25S rRNA (Uridine(2843)-N(3))-methyltransferase n=1 Tax=Thyridium curvatum TaxID=1093900 RepID=A0A507ASR9_9PEZI|nr:uncharacterized protein E0L32_008352 [Thyridium curvatum]TPX10783.1 hypothetical protein E0L32_008352 [Thyridium curvatum]